MCLCASHISYIVYTDFNKALGIIKAQMMKLREAVELERFLNLCDNKDVDCADRFEFSFDLWIPYLSMFSMFWIKPNNILFLFVWNNLSYYFLFFIREKSASLKGLCGLAHSVGSSSPLYVYAVCRQGYIGAVYASRIPALRRAREWIPSISNSNSIFISGSLSHHSAASQWPWWHQDSIITSSDIA